eukprot:m.121867 g.121867  ORF g.121867 m.121867 type:complete len:613 (-) comp19643_c0_seq2:221-2059(-)
MRAAVALLVWATMCICCAQDLPCSSPIYCWGDLLQTVQLSGLFQDSKTFVDMPLRFTVNDTLRNFSALPSTPTLQELRNFVDEHFLPAGSDLDVWTPDDWTSSPQLVANTSRIVDDTLRSVASGVNQRWRILGRMMNQSVQQQPEQHSLLYVTHPFVVPGGRFREFYYWDTYWIVKGLLLCEMTNTVRGMIANFALDLVPKFGMVPNGGRVYYSKRSQPPVLSLMVDDYLKATGDNGFLAEVLPQLQVEHAFWMSNRTVLVSTAQGNFTLNRYDAPTQSPRPESFREDWDTALPLTSAKAKEQLWHEIASGAETGWDFSTRWLRDKDSHNISSIHTTDVVPLDLNCILYRVELALASFFTLMGNVSAADSYRTAAAARETAISAVFWNEQNSSWHDYSLQAQSQVPQSYASVFVPLWAGLADSWPQSQREVVYAQLVDQGWFQWDSGVPTSFIKSAQQWDFPNMWPPLLSFAVHALRKLDVEDASKQALQLAQKYVSSVTEGWLANPDHYIFEKYNVESQGGAGGGGEYTIQTGFGWSCGTLLELMNMYGAQLQSPVPPPSPPSPPALSVRSEIGLVVGIVVGLVVIATGGLLAWRHTKSRKEEAKYFALNG